jgi:hypothetical protein
VRGVLSLEALTWRDLDSEAWTISLSDVPVDVALRPLLERMREEADDDDAPTLPVLREVNDKFRAKQLREHLRLSEVTRERVFAETATLL